MENSINQRIKALLKAEGLSVNKLAEGASIKQPSLSKQINGDTNISLDTLLLIIERIPNASIEWIVIGKGDMYKKDAEPKGLIDKILSSLPSCGDEEYYEKELAEKDKEIRSKNKEINRLNQVIASLDSNNNNA